MKKKKKTLRVQKKEAEWIEKLLATEPKSEDDCLGEDSTIINTVNFGKGIEMDIKLCGVQYREDEDTNKPWTEAVLFDNGAEVTCSEPDDEYFQKWELEYDGMIYTANVMKGVL